MTTTTRAAEFAAAALKMLEDSAHMTSITAQDTCVKSSQAFATLAIDARLADLVEEERTANKIAAYQAELIVNPYGVGTHEHDKWWVDFGTPITEAVQR